jgi:hypothetical protein
MMPSCASSPGPHLVHTSQKLRCAESFCQVVINAEFCSRTTAAAQTCSWYGDKGQDLIFSR